MKELIIINTKQYGYHTDTYMYCKYLKNKYNITYYCIDQGLKKIEEINLNVFYSEYKPNFIARYYYFMQSILKASSKIDQNKTIFVVYFRFAFLLKIFLSCRNIILDIRTLSVNKYHLIRFFENLLLQFNILFFNKISVISDCIAKKLFLKNYNVLPLGSEIISKTIKNDGKLKLLYVGTLYNRKIENIVKAVVLVQKKNKEIISSLDIFGTGKLNEIRKLEFEIKKNNLTKIIKYHGYKNHKEIKSYFDFCNVGISYVPIKSYYDCQPPTKTFEYVLSGMYCIATSTKSNGELINKNNGILTNDDFFSFSESIIKTFHNIKKINFSNIRKTLENNKWEEIVNNYFSKIINIE